MSQRLLALIGLVLFVAVATVHAQDGELTEIRENFDGARWSRHWWSIDQHSPRGVKVDLSGNALHFVVPPGPAGRPPAAMKGRFFLEGDFDVRVDYAAKSLPQPKSEWINIQVFIDGAGGPAAVIRTNNSTAGSGYSLWWEPHREGAKGGWAHEPTESLKGTLRLTRVGETLRFWYAENVVPSLRDGDPTDAVATLADTDPADEGFVEIGSAKYGADAITSVELWVSVPELPSPVDVTFDNLVVSADRIRDPSVPAPSAVGPRGAYRLIAAGCAGVLAIAAWLTWRSRSKRAK
jgi:hypothetical protein